MQGSKTTLFKITLFLKTVALFTFITFVSTQAIIPPALALDPNSNVPGGDPVTVTTGQVPDGTIVVPPELGTISEAYRVPRSSGLGTRLGSASDESRGASPESRYDRMVVFIQDAHDSLEAQENIAKIINHLVVHNGVKTVFEEGYEGPVPTDKYFGFIKDPELKRKVAWFFLDHLRVGGAEYAHINRAKDFKLIGADSIRLHKENINQYRLSAEKKEAITQDLKALTTEVQSLAGKRFPKELLEWLKLKDRFDAKQLDLFTYISRTLPLIRMEDGGWRMATSAKPAPSALRHPRRMILRHFSVLLWER